jgi:hypothetical protein
MADSSRLPRQNQAEGKSKVWLLACVALGIQLSVKINNLLPIYVLPSIAIICLGFQLFHHPVLSKLALSLRESYWFFDGPPNEHMNYFVENWKIIFEHMVLVVGLILLYLPVLVLKPIILWGKVVWAGVIEMLVAIIANVCGCQLPPGTSFLFTVLFADWKVSLACSCADCLPFLLIKCRELITKSVLQPTGGANISKEERYGYSDPVEGKIRILKFTPTLYGLNCTMVHVELEKAPSFETMSYTWGEDQEEPFEHVIIIDNQTLSIPKSAYDVLKQQVSMWRTKLIWIDFICINQKSTDDRNQQVYRMKDIYQAASRTIICLGTAPDAKEAMGLFVTLLNLASIKPLSQAQFLGHRSVNDDNPKWIAMNRMLNHRYWSRVWIVQEVAVSRKVHINYGQYWWNWTHFGSVVSSLMSNDNGLLQQVDLKEGWSTPSFYGISKVFSVNSVRNEFQQGKRLPLSKIIIGFGSSQASKPQDFVFGFWGLSSAQSRNELIPNVNIKVRDVFRDVLIHSLLVEEKEDKFQLLTCAGVNRVQPKDPLWPSWVPDFATISKLAYPPHPLSERESYKASYDTVSKIVHTPGSYTLAISGIFIDEIKAIACTSPDYKSIASFRGLGDWGSEQERQVGRQQLLWAKRFREAEELASAHISDTYFNGQSRWEAFWRTQLCNRGSATPGSYPAPDTCGDDYRNFVNSIERSGKVMSKEAGQRSITDMLPMSEQSGVDLPTSNNSGTSYEDTLDSIHRLMRSLLPSEVPSLRNYLTAEMLENPKALLEEILKLVSLPAWAVRDMRSVIGNNVPVETGTESKAFDLFWSAAFSVSDITEENAELVMKRMYLTYGLMFSGAKINISAEQMAEIQRMSKVRQEENEVLLGKRFGLLAGSTCAVRQLAVTKTGYLASVLPETRIGDRICVFLGAQYPHVVRRTKERNEYLLVGDAYVHGFMDGYAFEKFPWASVDIKFV